MEPTPESLRKRFRLVLKILKAQVVERRMDMIKLAIGGSTTITVTDPILSRSDVVAGDILTLYTEVTLADSSHSPKQ